MNKVIIGSQEWCCFPELGIGSIKARVDSGAKTSSIHAENINVYSRHGEQWVSFDVMPLQKSRRSVRCEAKLIDKRVIKSSTGDREKRYVVQTTLKIANQIWTIELTLANRDSMGFRMLLGREAMGSKFIVDPSEDFLLGDISESELNELYRKNSEKQTGLKIGLLASNPELYSNKRIVETCQERGHEIVFLDVQQCYMKIDAQSPEIHYRGGRAIKDLDAVIPRIKPSVTFYGCALLRQFEALNVFCLNGSEAIRRSRDKLLSLQMLLAQGVPIPTTGFAKSPLETNDLISMVGGAPLIVKLLEGTQGRGVVLAETKKAAESVVNAFKSLNANILVQQYIKEAQGKDLRCFVVGGKVIAVMQREAAPDDFRANLHRGGKASIVKISAEERKLAIKAAKVFNLHVAGVDIIRSNKGPLLLEVNSSPGLEGIETATNKDIGAQLIVSIEKALKYKAI